MAPFKKNKSATTKLPSLPSHLLHLSTLQLITRAAPFTHAQNAPLRSLTDLLGSYLSLLALAARDNADLAGRDSVSVWDVGRALDEFAGTSTSTGLRQLKEECKNSQGGGGLEGRQLRELAQGLSESYGDVKKADPICQISFDALTNDELDHLYQIKEEASISDEEDEDSEQEGSSPPTSDGEMMVIVKQEAEDVTIAEAEESYSLWQSPSLIPSYVPDFLPPFPGMERKAVGMNEPGKRKREKERERDAAAEAWAGINTSTSDPWIDIVPYSASTIAQTNIIPILPSISPPASPSGRLRRRKSLSPPPLAATSSLPAYLTEMPHIVATPPSYAFRNPKRRSAATLMATSSLTLASDSLFGSIPIDSMRAASLEAGFYPDDVPFMPIHPFSTCLPWTISRPVPSRPSPHALLAAPPLNARTPTIVSQLAHQLSAPDAPDLQLFSRLTRSGPPGPLSSAGKALEYCYVGDTGIVEPHFDWKRRFHNARLPKAATGHAAEGKGDAKTGIKLNLKRGSLSTGGEGSSSAVASPAPFAAEGGGVGGPMESIMESIGEESTFSTSSSTANDPFPPTDWNAIASSSLLSSFPDAYNSAPIESSLSQMPLSADLMPPPPPRFSFAHADSSAIPSASTSAMVPSSITAAASASLFLDNPEFSAYTMPVSSTQLPSSLPPVDGSSSASTSTSFYSLPYSTSEGRMDVETNEGAPVIYSEIGTAVVPGPDFTSSIDLSMFGIVGDNGVATSAETMDLLQGIEPFILPMDVTAADEIQALLEQGGISADTVFGQSMKDWSAQ